MKIKILISISIFTWLFCSIFSISSAANLEQAFSVSSSDNGPLGLMADSAGYKIDGTVSFLGITSMVITSLLSLMGVIFLVLLIYGGFLWMTAKGNEQQVEKAKEVMYSAIIGLIIVLAAYAISYFVVDNLTKGVLKEV